jgi:hypothetical protein
MVAVMNPLTRRYVRPLLSDGPAPWAARQICPAVMNTFTVEIMNPLIWCFVGPQVSRAL